MRRLFELVSPHACARALSVNVDSRDLEREVIAPPTKRAAIVMYHYVRELTYSRYPRIKALLPSQFEAQLDYMQRHYTFVRVEDCLAAVYEDAELPRNAALLTFDDGYIDHYATVFPCLAERKIQGAFFPPAEAVIGHRVLDVNKIHFVLASARNTEALVDDIFAILDELRAEHHLQSNQELYARFAVPSRFDPAPVIFIKRALQKGLPEEVRAEVITRLFAKYVSVDETAFARELYVSPAQLRLMARSGMYVGSHGHRHRWLGELTQNEQIAEVDASLVFLRELGIDTEDWIMCYPYGSYNDSLIEIIRERGCKLGLSTRIDLAQLDRGNAFILPRLDTNDLPKDAAAPLSRWTAQQQDLGLV